MFFPAYVILPKYDNPKKIGLRNHYRGVSIREMKRVYVPTKNIRFSERLEFTRTGF